MKRAFDLLLALNSLPFLLVLMFPIYLLVKLTSRGSAIYWSDRMGKDNVPFRMPKFRTMKMSTPEVAAHDLVCPEQFLTPVGSFLRKSSLDELPQIWSILKGDMSFVGPRPVLTCEKSLIELRTRHGVHKVVPGLTGLAQINGRTEINSRQKLVYDVEYAQKQSLLLDMKIIFRTFFKVIRGDGVHH